MATMVTMVTSTHSYLAIAVHDPNPENQLLTVVIIKDTVQVIPKA